MMQAEPSMPGTSEQAELTPSDNPIHSTAEGSKSSNNDFCYAVIIKYDHDYVKSYDGILRFFNVVFAFLYLVMTVSGGSYQGDYLSLPFAWHLRLIVFTCIASLLICIFVIGLRVSSTLAMCPVNWQLFDIIVYGTLTVLFLLTVILLSVDINDSTAYSQVIPPSTNHLHIAALVFGICCILAHGSIIAVVIYQRAVVENSSSSNPHGILLSQQSSSSVVTAESAGPCA